MTSPIAPSTLLDIAARHGTPAYVYDLGHVRRRVTELRAALGGTFRISYAVKANPNAQVLRAMRDLVDTLDVSSAGEIDRALAAGWPPGRIGFTGPAKRTAELQCAVDARLGDVIVESLDEIDRLAATAAAAGIRQSVLIRLCPDTVVPGFGSRMAGKPTQFGIEENLVDEAVAAIRRSPALQLNGFHLYAGTQCLKAEAIVANIDATLSLFEAASIRNDLCPRRLIVGSGLGIPYHDGDRPLDLAAIGPAVQERVARFRQDQHFAETELLLETGRFLVGEAGVYLTRVITTKLSRGHAVVICDGGMHHHLAAAGHLGSVLHRNYPIAKVATDLPPIETWKPQLIFGPLCTSIDLLANQLPLPPLRPGDLISIASSGAYGLSSSPVGFISHPPPAEVIIDSEPI